MDKLRIFNMALNVFNQPPLTQEQLDDKESIKQHPEIQTLELFYLPALRKAMREHPWSFLDVELDLGEDLGPKGGYAHSYVLPEGLFRLTRADGTYEVHENTLFTNGRPVAYGQMSEVPDTVPDDFEYLVALSLAVIASPKLSSGDQKVNYAAQFYDSLLLSMELNDAQNARRDNREIIDGYGAYV